MYDSIKIPELPWGGDNFKPKFSDYEPMLAEIVCLYRDELLSFEEIGEQLGIEWWNIKQMFKKYNITKYSIKERACLKRKKDYPQIYKLHHSMKLSFKAIYRDYGFSPSYSKLVLKEGGEETNKVTLPPT
ncbi:hypothetical protein [Paenibacillus sp. FSL H3-0333]|uniref:hypothetical protein n=1 Tax=Paenibacillus sp. FSL H3-0333 TaxID=2921373 RepID=UPI0030F7DEC5